MRDYLLRIIAIIKGELAKLKLFKSPNATIFGYPINKEGQISGFSANDYLQFPFMVDFRGRKWQIDFAFTTGVELDYQQNILDSEFGLAFAVRDRKLVMALSSDGKSWNLGEHVSRYELDKSTTYKARLIFTGKQYLLFISKDGGDTYHEFISFDCSESLAPKQMLIGKSVDGKYPFLGIIDMNEASLVIEDELIWQGMDDAGLSTRADKSLSNIDEAGRKTIGDISVKAASEVVEEVEFDKDLDTEAYHRLKARVEELESHDDDQDEEIIAQGESIASLRNETRTASAKLGTQLDAVSADVNQLKSTQLYYEIV